MREQQSLSKRQIQYENRQYLLDQYHGLGKWIGPLQLLTIPTTAILGYDLIGMYSEPSLIMQDHLTPGNVHLALTTLITTISFGTQRFLRSRQESLYGLIGRVEDTVRRL